MTRRIKQKAPAHWPLLNSKSLSDGGKVMCPECGRSGYVGGTWADSCLKGHPYECNCGRKFSTSTGMASHKRKTKGHP